MAFFPLQVRCIKGKGHYLNCSLTWVSFRKTPNPCHHSIGPSIIAPLSYVDILCWVPSLPEGRATLSSAMCPLCPGAETSGVHLWKWLRCPTWPPPHPVGIQPPCPANMPPCLGRAGCLTPHHKASQTPHPGPHLHWDNRVMAWGSPMYLTGHLLIRHLSKTDGESIFLM